MAIDEIDKVTSQNDIVAKSVLQALDDNASRAMAEPINFLNLDIISLADTGVPYYESISLVGTRHSGTGERPFMILGNGATLSLSLIHISEPTRP